MEMRTGFPQHYAAASLKLLDMAFEEVDRARFSAALRCGLIEAHPGTAGPGPPGSFSAALRCGLIEAERGTPGTDG